MARMLRVDQGVLGNVERTPQGGVKIPATLTRSGVFTYQTPNGPIREYRSPAEVTRADSLASLRNAPITIKHPPKKIDPSSYRQYARGHVGEDVRIDGEQVAATLYVQDDAAIKSIEGGMRHVSCGYYCDTEEQPGIVPAGERDAGMHYDRAQKNIDYNHLAILERGRAGDARLRLDGDAETNEEESDMKTERIDGVDYEIGTEPHKAAVLRRDAAERVRNDELVTLRADREAQRARADAAEAKEATARAALAESVKPANFDRAVKERSEVVAKAIGVLGKDFKADGLTDAEIKRKAVAKAYPALKLDGESEDYVKGLWASLAPDAKRGERDDAAEKILRETAPMPGARGSREDGTGDGKTTTSLKQIRNDAMADAEEQHKKPFALSRRDRAGAGLNGGGLQSAQLETQR